MRGDVWRIRQLHTFERCTIIHVEGVTRGNAREQKAFIVPFDRVAAEDRRRGPWVVRRTRWRRALRALLARQHPCGGLRRAAIARIQLLPFQLEPALAAVRGLACRMLLADEVGLGKTIQAGLVLSELHERAWADRTLILTPAGLRLQWQTELREHFSIDATIVDTPLLHRRASLLPAATNPWLLDPVAIASIDLIKRPEAQRGLESIVWDLLIVDEAHLAAAAPRRHAGVDVLARRARRVVMITATPHAGDSAAFASLCRLGDLTGEPVALFRRCRAQIGLTNKRRVRTLPVRLDADELSMHQRLRRYAELVMRDSLGRQRGSVLAMTVLMKRALSSPQSLSISIDRRLQMLAADTDLESQLSLPLINDDTDDRDQEPLRILRAPGLADRELELACLREVGAAARALSLGHKLRVLARLVRRISEPVLVFTEYRDTLQEVAAVLGPAVDIAVIHGGLTEAERVRAQIAFTTGTARVLLATDAAGEGLNLHRRCRLVVNLELPWNPMRLEQRIGRVDRMNQTRTVHALNLFARGTIEGEVLGRLVRRLERARQGVGLVNDPLGRVNEDEADLTCAIFDRTEESASHSGTELKELVWMPNLRDEAIVECRRLEYARHLAIDECRTIDEGRAVVTTMSARRLSGPLSSPTLTFVFVAELVDAAGQSIEVLCIPLTGPLSGLSMQRPVATCGLVEHVLEAARPTLLDCARQIADDRLERARHQYRATLDAPAAREAALLEAIKASAGADHLFQAGLFDTRAARDRVAHAVHHTLQLANVTARLKQIDLACSSAAIATLEPRLVLLVVGPVVGVGCAGR